MKNLLWLKISILLLFIVIRIKAQENNNEQKSEKERIYYYCNQFNNTGASLNQKIVKKLTKEQYVLKNFDELVADNLKLDYYVRFILASKGFCYYSNPEDLKPLDEWDKQLQVQYIENVVYNETTNSYGAIQGSRLSKVRYARSTLCSYYYSLAADDASKNTVISHSVCQRYCYDFYFTLSEILLNQEYCSLPDPNTMVTPAITPGLDLEGTIEANKIKFLEEIYNYCNNNQNQACDARDNEEVVNCGFGNPQDKIEYCKTNNEPCCYLTYDIDANLKIVSMEYSKTAIISGISSAVACILVGSYFSLKFIKEIKMQESIKKSIKNQEKEYQESTKQLLKDAYKNGYNPNDQVFNSTSRNLNTGTLRPRGVDPVSTMNSYGSSSRTGGTTLGRYPPNSYTVSQDYQSSDDRDVSLRRGMIVQLIQKYEGGWVMVRDINSNRQGYAPEYCLGNKMA